MSPGIALGGRSACHCSSSTPAENASNSGSDAVKIGDDGGRMEWLAREVWEAERLAAIRRMADFVTKPLEWP